MLARVRLDVAMTMRARSRHGIATRCISTARLSSSIGIKAGGGGRWFRPRGDMQRYPAHRHSAQHALPKSASGFHPTRSFRISLPRYASEGLVCSIRWRKSYLGRPQGTAPALPHSMTRARPRRAIVQSFANCDGGGYDRLRPVSCERRLSWIGQRTSACASEPTSAASPLVMNCGHCR